MSENWTQLGLMSMPSAEPGLGDEPHGLSRWLAGPGPGGAWPSPPGPQAEWEAPRVSAWDRSRGSRAARLKALGNAVVPQCAELVGWAINEMEGV
jgi:hypothetical protein